MPHDVLIENQIHTCTNTWEEDVHYTRICTYVYVYVGRYALCAMRYAFSSRQPLPRVSIEPAATCMGDDHAGAYAFVVFAKRKMAIILKDEIHSR